MRIKLLGAAIAFIVVAVTWSLINTPTVSPSPYKRMLIHQH